jgi:hypothetical protein
MGNTHRENTGTTQGTTTNPSSIDENGPRGPLSEFCDATRQPGSRPNDAP